MTTLCATATTRVAEETKGVAEEIFKRVALNFYLLHLRGLNVLDMHHGRKGTLGSIRQIYSSRRHGHAGLRGEGGCILGGEHHGCQGHGSH